LESFVQMKLTIVPVIRVIQKKQIIFK